MPLTIKQHRQFMVLITGDIGINQRSLKHSRQNIITVNQHSDILTHITTTQFDLILVDLTVTGLELIARIKDPLCINNKTPVIAIINAPTALQGGRQYPMEFDDCLVKPITEDQLDKLLDLWQTKALALDYIQTIMTKTKHNQQLALTIFKMLFEELPLQVLAINNALEKKQYTLAQEITHQLHGSVSFCGLTDIQQPARVLESSLLTNNYASTHLHFLTLQQHTFDFTRHQAFILEKLQLIP